MRRVLASGDFASVEQCSIAPLASALSEAARTLTFEQALGMPGASRGIAAS